MLIVPLYTLLILYAIFLLVFFTFFVINFFHILLTGTNTLGSFIATFIIMALSILTFYATWYYLPHTGWQQPLTTLNVEYFRNLFQPGDGQYF